MPRPVVSRARGGITKKRQELDGSGKKVSCRRSAINRRCYTDNSCSVGGKVKEQCSVISTRLLGDRRKVKLNINCRIDGLAKLMAKFNDIKQDWVKEMGMYSLVHMCDVGCLPAQLCYWLASRVDVENKALVSLDGVRFTLSNVQIHWILGIPKGSLKVPRKGSTPALKEQVKDIWDKYSTKSGRTRGIFLKSLLDVLHSDEVDELQLKRVFLMFLLGQVLCPTTSYRISVSLLPAVTIATDAKNYDWCSLVLDYLLRAIRNFGKRFYPDGFSPGCGGCMIYLAIFYLDRLKRIPNEWGVWPRIAVWSEVEINKAQADDSLEGGDFGGLGCVNVAYTEKHPFDARDAMPSESVNYHVCEVLGCVASKKRVRRRSGRESNLSRKKRCVEKEAGGGVNIEGCESAAVLYETVVEDVVAGVFCDLDPNLSVADQNLSAVNDNLTGTVPRYEWSSLSTQQVFNEDFISDLQEPVVGDGSNIGHENAGDDENVGNDSEPDDDDNVGDDDEYGERNEADDESQCCTPQPITADLVQISRSRKRRKTKLSAALSGMYVQLWEPRGLGRYQSKLGRFAVIGFQLVGGIDKALIRCDDVVATITDCSTLLSDDSKVPVSANYVRAAAEVYHRMWDDFFVGHSRRILMDPSFASMVLNTSVGSLPEAVDATKFAKRLVEISRSKFFNLVFIPVQTRCQWWCVIISFSNGEVGVFDPLDPVAAVSNHHEEVLKLKNAVDELLTHLKPSWQLSCFNFRSYSLKVNRPVGDTINSGLEMLIAVKRSAFRVEYGFTMGPKAGEMLLSEHVMCKFNEAKNEVIELLKEYMD